VIEGAGIAHETRQRQRKGKGSQETETKTKTKTKTKLKTRKNKVNTTNKTRGMALCHMIHRESEIITQPNRNQNSTESKGEMALALEV
jgi:hypothetical protein